MITSTGPMFLMLYAIYFELRGYKDLSRKAMFAAAFVFLIDCVLVTVSSLKT